MAEKSEEKNKQKALRGIVGTHGRTFEGIVTKKFQKRVVLEFERTIYIPKYERFQKKKTRLHARISDVDVDVGDHIKVRESRPLSKIIHFVVIKKIKGAKE